MEMLGIGAPPYASISLFSVELNIGQRIQEGARVCQQTQVSRERRGNMDFGLYL